MGYKSIDTDKLLDKARDYIVKIKKIEEELSKYKSANTDPKVMLEFMAYSKNISKEYQTLINEVDNILQVLQSRIPNNIDTVKKFHLMEVPDYSNSNGYGDFFQKIYDVLSKLLNKDKQIMNPLISVIVPVYNVEKYLNQCVDSILAQTYNNFELILVDDGSTDKSGEICDKYKEKDPQIIVKHQKNSGPAVARNLGLSLAKGDWITFVDSDDYLDSDGFYNMINAGKNCDMVISGKIIEEGNDINKILPKDALLKNEYPGALFLDCEIAKSRDYIWNRFYKLSIIKDNHISFQEIKTGEDTLFNLAFHKFCHTVRIFNYAYYHHILRGNTLSSGFHSDTITFLNTSMNEYRNLRNLSGNRVKKLKYFIDGIRIDNFHVEIVNYIYAAGSKLHDAKKLIAQFDNRYKKDASFMELLKTRKDKSRIVNHRIQRMLFLHFPIVFFVLYNIFVGKLKQRVHFKKSTKNKHIFE